MKRTYIAILATFFSIVLFAQAKEQANHQVEQQKDSTFTTINVEKDSALVSDEKKRIQDSLLIAHMAIVDQQTIPADTSVRTGVLKNGLTYYVRRCTEPENKANFCLLVKGGSTIEKEKERGIAHFVEHMLFKGTKHFPGQDVIGFMRRNGIPFGHDSNAFTGYETVRYVLNTIPTGDELQMDSCLLLLRDWAGDATIDDKDVESERNVIVEEWRSRNTISFSQQFLFDLFNNSFHSKRLPIGDIEIIKNCKPQLVRNFYKRWYQPQNQAVVVTGHFDADKMVEKIEKIFGTMKRGKNTVPMKSVIPDHDTLQVHIYQDPQLPIHACSIIIRQPKDKSDLKNQVGDFREELVLDKLKELMGNQLKTLKDNETLSSNTYMLAPSDVKDARFIVFETNSSPDNWKTALEKLTRLMEGLRRKGFTDYEHNPQNVVGPTYNEDYSAILFPDTVFSQYVSKRSNEWTDRLVNSFFNGNAINDYSSEQATKNHIRNTITREQVDGLYRELTSGRNMMVSLMFPKDASLPTEDEVKEIISRAKDIKDEELADIGHGKEKKLEILHVKDLDINPVPGTLVKTTVLNDSISEFLLSNGVKVVLMRKKTAKNSINMMFDRPMGYSALRDDEVNYQDMLSSCRRHFEYVGGYALIQTNAYDDIIDVPLSFRTPDNAEHWNNIEQQLKMIHATLTTTEVDSVEAAEKIQNIQSAAITINNSIIVSQLSILNLPAASSKRLMPPTVEEAKTYTLDRFRELIKEYYSNFNGSLLVVQGEVDTDSIMPLLLKYIGSLPSKPEPVKRTAWSADHFKTTNTTVVEKTENATPICSTFLFYTWEKDFQYTQESHAHNQVLQSVLRNILLNTLRVQHSDVYTPRCTVQDDILPFHRMKCLIAYTCDPAQRERIARDVTQLVHDMAEGDLITQDLIDSYIKEREKLKDNFKSNDYTVRRDYINRELNGIVVNEGDTSYIKQITPSSLKNHMRQLLKKGNLHIGYLTTE